ncbi:uncharacterized protein LOC134192021 [Corticium candelabrum]|uniref:uncharacterized protein LOC134192021 n=1 Tax=Corticium candelabrum TaxID=121492 RepID=UPI002E26869F|nr:uncharacterized protein LOC134192021 [Corticium candelabrum]
MQARIEVEREFLLWKARKDDEYRAAQIARRKLVEEEERRLERKRISGLIAYETWKSLQERKREEQLQERHQLQAQRELENAAKGRKLEQARLAFNNWKERKERERRKGKELEHKRPSQTISTPSLPGYCSVWECDSRLAHKMHTVCPRQERIKSSRHFTTTIP